MCIFNDCLDTYRLAHKILVHIANAKNKMRLKAHADATSWARDFKLDLSHSLQSYVVYERNERSDESAHMRRLV